MFDSSKYLSSAEDQYFLKMMARIESRDTLILSLLRRYGMRASELLALRKCDLNESDRSIRVMGLKGSRGREFLVKRDLFQRLLRHSFELKGEDRIFPLSYNRLCEIWHLYRPAKKPLHSLRHTFAVEIYKRSKNIQLVQQALGHKSLSNTMIYQQYEYTRSELGKFTNL